MISRFFKPQTKISVPASPAVPAGTVVWAVGDIHGRLDLLQPLVEAMTADLQDSRAERKLVIFLGDYIDRGPDSDGVLRLLSGLSQAQGVEWRFLKGNHEQAMLEFLNDPSAGPRWCEHGGDEALRSWGLRVPALAHKTEAWVVVAADLRHKLTKAELRFLETLELSVTVGDYFFVHAGARPGIALDRQAPQDLMWIRQPFLNSQAAFERVVVHGHTATLDVHADQRRIGIDTKAYDSGLLSAVRLEGNERALLQAAGPRRNENASLRVAEDEPGESRGVVIRREKLNLCLAEAGLIA